MTRQSKESEVATTSVLAAKTDPENEAAPEEEPEEDEEAAADEEAEDEEAASDEEAEDEEESDDEEEEASSEDEEESDDEEVASEDEEESDDDEAVASESDDEPDIEAQAQNQGMDRPMEPHAGQDANADYAETEFKRGPIWIRVDLTPEAAKRCPDRLHLFSESGEYDQEQPVSEYTDAGEDTVDLLFEDAPMNQAYTLEVHATGGKTYTVFENVTYGDLRREKDLAAKRASA